MSPTENVQSTSSSNHFDSRDLVLTSDHSTDESIIVGKIPSKTIYAFGASKILHSARISLLDSERLSNLRYLILSDEALYIFDDSEFERRISNDQVQEIVTNGGDQKSSRLLFRVNPSSSESDLLIICKGATGFVEALEKALVFKFSEVADDLFSKARFTSDPSKPSVDALKQALTSALQSEDVKNTMLNLELLRRSNVDWENDELISRAIEFVKTK